MNEIKEASKFSIRNRVQLEKSKIAGCYCCLKIFNPKDVVEFWDDDQTGVCPYCGIDSVLGDESGYSIDINTLKQLKAYWFYKD
jgi:hypothetical protein